MSASGTQRSHTSTALRCPRRSTPRRPHSTMTADILTNSLLSDTTSSRTKRHPWNREIQQRISSLYELDNWHVSLAILADYFVLGIAVCIPFWAGQYLGF